MSCQKLTQKKYATRPGPALSAMDCKNEVRKGNNGKTYKSVKNKKGIYQWKKMDNVSNSNIPKGAKTYMTMHNGDQPYTVIIQGNHVMVLKNDYDESSNKFIPGKKLLDMKVDEIHIGEDPLKVSPVWEPKFKGNSMLVKSGNKYTYIGRKIYSFQPKDKIVKYFSMMGNSLMPYPYAQGDKHTYLVIEEKLVDNDVLDLSKDAYDQFYQYKDAELQDKIQKASKDMKIKMIHSGI